jgi:hypothetical protein
VPHITEDAFMAPHLQAGERLVGTGALPAAAEEATGPLH